jgi:hypothetical protein
MRKYCGLSSDINASHIPSTLHRRVKYVMHQSKGQGKNVEVKRVFWEGKKIKLTVGRKRKKEFTIGRKKELTTGRGIRRNLTLAVNGEFWR